MAVGIGRSLDVKAKIVAVDRLLLSSPAREWSLKQAQKKSAIVQRLQWINTL